MFKFNAYHTVHPTVKATSDSPIDFAALQQQDRLRAETEAAEIRDKKAMENFMKQQKKEEYQAASFAPQRLMNAKMEALNYMDKNLGNQLFAEAFAQIYIGSLPHDPEFIAEHYNALKEMAYMYTRKLGGLPYLKKVSESSDSYFLKKFYNVITETAKKIQKRKTKKVMNALTDNEAMDIVRGKISDEDQKDLLSHINDLGVDELTELIKDKVISVVKDEHQREKDDREFRTVLKNDLEDPNNAPVEDSEDDESDEDVADDDGRLDTGDQPEDVDSMDDSSAPEDAGKPNKEKKDKSFDFQSSEKEEKKSKKEDKAKKTEKSDDLTDGSDAKKSEDKKMDKDKKDKKQKTGLEGYSVSEMMQKWDPIHESFSYNKNTQPKTLMFSIASSVARDMIKSAAMTEGQSVTSIDPSKNSYVVENPLNLDIFATFMKDNADGIEEMELAQMHEPKILGSSEMDRIDPNQIMTEAVLQYTLLEAAYTMKLINPTVMQIKQQSDYLLGIN